ncbi:YceI family protein [Amycolatopsis sp. ATCC 39116]|uniref:YceI family protein n=1 Tax=Amycolatopsis sp. (strain ATCC 39116 / 75iv2) TaxID=385957 RepID=UPI00026255CF|nr:YceI family protein [Amycolatopsis sp. ATCC 39116]
MTAVRSGNWTVVAAGTTARFAVRNLGFNRVTGTIPVRGGSVQGMAVRAELDLAGLETGHAKRDADLRKPSLLDSAARPVLRFTGTAVDAGRVDGALELRGAICPITLTVQPAPDDRPEAPHLIATGVLDRAPLRMRVPRFVIGRHIEITVDVRLAPG